MTGRFLPPRAGLGRLAGGLVVLGAVSILVWLAVAKMGGGSDTWLRVDRRDLVLEISTEGELRAVDSALIGPPQLRRLWNFQISMIGPEGEEVAAGQPVLGFDTTELRQRLRQSTAPWLPFVSSIEFFEK